VPASWRTDNLPPLAQCTRMAGRKSVEGVEENSCCGPPVYSEMSLAPLTKSKCRILAGNCRRNAPPSLADLCSKASEAIPLCVAILEAPQCAEVLIREPGRRRGPLGRQRAFQEWFRMDAAPPRPCAYYLARLPRLIRTRVLACSRRRVSPRSTWRSLLSGPSRALLNGRIWTEEAWLCSHPPPVGLVQPRGNRRLVD